MRPPDLVELFDALRAEQRQWRQEWGVGQRTLDERTREALQRGQEWALEAYVNTMEPRAVEAWLRLAHYMTGALCAWEGLL